MEVSTWVWIIFGFCILAACAFEFINGFHDTANAVATVIYTNTLKPNVAVPLSALMNFTGVLLGGTAVAMGIVDLLPVELLINTGLGSSIAMILALIFSAIFWNLGTWYLGIPASSSHTLIGSILGVGLAHSMLNGELGEGVNWSKASEIGMSLLISPLFGFGLTLFLMFFLMQTIKNKKIFSEPEKDKKPPLWIRVILIFTCSGVSFFHGSNDGQKGVGLVMLILIGVLPGYFALNEDADLTKVKNSVYRVEVVLSKIDPSELAKADRTELMQIDSSLSKLKVRLSDVGSLDQVKPSDRFALRSEFLMVTRKAEKLLKEKKIFAGNVSNAKELKLLIKEARQATDYAPAWVILMISISLGLGTMIGWKRIVVTIGEKIGKTHLTYAQGASAELVAASTIGVSTFLGLPVSTTHVLSSGIAGSMVANNGLKNLQAKTVKNIVWAWVLTLPVTMGLSAVLFFVFYKLF